MQGTQDARSELPQLCRDSTAGSVDHQYVLPDVRHVTAVAQVLRQRALHCGVKAQQPLGVVPQPGERISLSDIALQWGAHLAGSRV